jgi:radical SAM protein with 4Fe4S-binding SPASM domain
MNLPIRKLQVLGIDIVHGCQLRCVGCPNSGLNPKIRFMPLEDFSRCLGNVDVSLVKTLRLFNYGEPLLHPDVPALLEQIPRQRFEVREVEISTNAQAHDFPMLAEIFRTDVLDTLVVSCDGDGTPEDYQRLRPPGKWERLVEFLRRARELRDAHGPETRLMTRTICETEEGRRRWLDLLVPLGFTPEFRGWLNLSDSNRTPSGQPDAAANGICIYLQRKTLYVDYDGTVVTCCKHPRAAVFGNLKESRFSEILRGRPRRRFVEQLKTDRAAMPICGQCDVRRHRHKIERVLQLPRRWFRAARLLTRVSFRHEPPAL